MHNKEEENEIETKIGRIDLDMKAMTKEDLKSNNDIEYDTNSVSMKGIGKTLIKFKGK